MSSSSPEVIQEGDEAGGFIHPDRSSADSGPSAPPCSILHPELFSPAFLSALSTILGERDDIYTHFRTTLMVQNTLPAKMLIRGLEYLHSADVIGVLTDAFTKREFTGRATNLLLKMVNLVLSIPGSDFIIRVRGRPELSDTQSYIMTVGSAVILQLGLITDCMSNCIPAGIDGAICLGGKFHGAEITRSIAIALGFLECKLLTLSMDVDVSTSREAIVEIDEGALGICIGTGPKDRRQVLIATKEIRAFGGCLPFL